MKKKEPKVIKVSDEELKDLKSNLENDDLSDSQKNIIIAVLEAYYWLSKMYEAKKLSLRKLKRLFGFKTEKASSPKKGDDKPKDKDSENNDKGPPPGGGKGGRPKGSGNKGKNDMPGANKVLHKLEDLKTGDLCPECHIGKVYPVGPGTHIQFTGHSPLQATIHETEKLRCNACGQYFEAALPEEAQGKYHASADAAIVVQKYALGLPFYRTGKWQHDMGVPLAASSLWGRCEAIGNSTYPVFQAMLEKAAEGELFYGDDTKNKILDVQKFIRENGEKRVGIYTTGIISKVGKRMISLFFTGRKYCGENLDGLLQLRKNESKAVLMSDALPMNLPKEAKVLWANCLTHSRRNFWDYLEKYPKMIRYVLQLFRRVYINDRKTKGMSDEDRLRYHQKHSGPIFLKLRRWGLKNIYLKKIEPNEELGGALKYFFKHYKELTLFLRLPGVPIDNTILERLLKTAILNRKNSYFYKTQFGAFIGDMMMSLIQTCRSSGINPQRYLQVLQENKDWVKKSPEQWLPWNFDANFQQ